MATAPNESRPAQPSPRAPRALTAEPMEFVIFKDNSGVVHGEIVAGDGVALARSGSFATHEETARPALRIRDGAGSALFDGRAAADPIDLLASGDGVSAEENAERWLDEGAGFRSEGVTDVAGGTLTVPPGETAGTLFAPPASSPGPPRELRDSYICPECGHVRRVSGLGRHRVYFERDDNGSESSVVNRVGPVCGCGLSGKNSK